MNMKCQLKMATVAITAGIIICSYLPFAAGQQPSAKEQQNIAMNEGRHL
jgi:hypothetical protein